MAVDKSEKRLFIKWYLFVSSTVLVQCHSVNECTVVNYGTSLTGEGDSVTGAVTLRSVSDLLKVRGSLCVLHSSHRKTSIKQYSGHGQSVTSRLEYCNGKNVSTHQL